MKPCLALLFLHLFVAPLWAQQYNVRTLPTQQQLPVANVHCILQDSEGYMWYGTEGGGLCRDNGYQVDVFRTDRNAPGLLASNVVTNLAEADGRYILFGTRSGLYAIDKRNYGLRRLLSEADTLSVDALLTDSRGHVWSAIGQRILCLSAQTLEVVDSFGVPTNSGSHVSSFYEDSHQRLWALMGAGGMLCFDTERRRFQSQPWPLDVAPTHMSETADGYWVGTWGRGIVHYSPNRPPYVELQDETQGVPDQNAVLSLLSDSHHNVLWATTMNDLYPYNIRDGHLSRMALGADIVPEGNKILDQLAEDRHGNIYVAGYTPHTFVVSADENGIRRYTVETIRRRTGFPLLADNSVAEGDDFWLWQGRVGLTFYQSTTQRLVVASDLGIRVERNIRGCRKQSGIWASDGPRLLHITSDGQSMQAEEIAILPAAEPIRAFSEDREGRLWLASDRHLYVYSLLSHTLRRRCDLDTPVHDLVAQSDGTLFLATSHALLRLLPHDKCPTALSVKNEDFTSVALAPDGTLWAATFEGNVYSCHPGTDALQPDSLMSNANGDAIKQVCTDALGHVWLLSDQYVREFNPRNHSFRTLRNASPFVDVSYFYSLSPVDDRRFCLNGAGAMCVLPSSARLDLPASGVQPLVSAIMVNGEKHLVGTEMKRMTFAPKQNNWTIQLTTLDHLHASSISFAYRMEGLSNRWVYLPQGVNAAVFSGIGKGHYKLWVKATDRYGCWGQEVCCMELVRRAAWYETWWAYVVYFCLVMALGVGLWHLEHRIQFLAQLIRRRREVRLDEIQLTPEAITSQRLDDNFLRDAVAQIERNLSRPDYTVGQFSSDMCMSRMNLYRRLHALTGQTPTEFIRDIRLKHAASLLASGTSATVSDIATRVGFSSPSYFAKCFKEKFGVQPKDYTSTLQS